jgi:lysophospholipase L1-like esterase
VTTPSLGVLAFGDSITNGGGELQWGVALQSWALWVARALGVPFSTYATDGARVADVVGEQQPAFIRRSVAPEGPYDLGCVYVGVNDVRASDWDAAGYERDLDRALAFLTARCERRLTLTIPLDLGRPKAAGKVREANTIIERLATCHDALVVDLSDFTGREHVMADHVHPTAFGQIAMAERALAVLSAHGLPAKVRPSALISYETTTWGQVRGAATYGYRRAKAGAHAMVDRARARSG